MGDKLGSQGRFFDMFSKIDDQLTTPRSEDFRA